MLARRFCALITLAAAACGPAQIGPVEQTDAGNPSAHADAKPGGNGADAGTPVSADPCGSVPTTGRCKTATTIEKCVQPTGLGTAVLATIDCLGGESCQMVGGEATCVRTALCVEGTTECQDSKTLRRCQGGAWVSETCASGCISSALGDSCATGGGLVSISGKVQYEARSPNSNKSDWGSLWNAPAQGFLIASVHQGATGSTYYDTAVTTAKEGDQGNFTLEVPASPTAADYVVVYAAGTRSDGSMSFVVADPRFTASATAYPTSQTPTSAAVWAWRWRASEVQNGATLTISEANGSGAARVFDYLRYVYSLGGSRWPGVARDPLVVWLGMGVEWSCGACEAAWPTTQFGTRFGSQIWFGGGDDDAYWADAVTAHELGHWIMGTFGRSVGEGGRHCFGVPSAPGLAWSEGWATWFSSDARGNAIYIDKQNGTMFWLDISSRDTSGSAWPRPVSSAGLAQDLYENEVSWMMWQLSATQGLGNEPLDAALASDRMTAAPFERGYTRHTWDTNDKCLRINIEDTGESTTHFADFLDALRCAGVSAAAIDAATAPSTRYPYPSSSPRCR